MRFDRQLFPHQLNSAFLRLSNFYAKAVRAMRSLRGRDEVDAMVALVVEDRTAAEDFLAQVKTLERIYRGSNKTDVRNLLRKDSGFKQDFDTYEKELDDLLTETKKIIVEVVADNSISFYKRSESLDKLFQKWTNLHSKVRDKIDKIGIIRSINIVTDYVLAYCYLCKSLYLINEKKTGDYYTDLVHVNRGLEILCQVVEVFYELIGESTISQIDAGIRSLISGFEDRSIREYFKEGFDNNIIVTRYKSFCTFLLSLTEVRLSHLNSKNIELIKSNKVINENLEDSQVEFASLSETIQAFKDTYDEWSEVYSSLAYK